MSLCCKTSSMLSTSRVYTLFYGQTDWFEKCSASLDDRRSDMFFFSYSSGGLPWLYFPCSSRETHLFGGGGFAENGENTAPIDPSIERRTYSYMDINTFRMSLEYHTEGETSEGTTLRTVHKTCSLLETLKFIIRILKSRCFIHAKHTHCTFKKSGAFMEVNLNNTWKVQLIQLHVSAQDQRCLHQRL